MGKEELIEYWIQSSDSDFGAMTHLFNSGDYAWSLFLGHIVLEKLLKAYCLGSASGEIPFTHDLLRIAEKASLSLSDAQKDFLGPDTTI